MLLLLLFAACQPQQSLEKNSTLDESNTILGLLVFPDSVILPVGKSVQLSAKGLTSDHESIDLTDSVEWVVSDDSVINISNSLDSEGVLQAEASGNALIFARYENLTSPESLIKVTDAELERLTVSPAELELIEGEKVQLEATAFFSNGDSGNITTQARWITADGTIVQFEDPGLLQAVGVGETQIRAEFQDSVSQSVDVDIDAYNENGRPDLLISEASGYMAGGIAEINVKIKNQGSKGASGFWLDLWVTRQTEPQQNEVGDEYVWIDYLGPNHYTYIDFSIPVSNPSGTVWILTDTTNNIDESHENNNDFSIPLAATDAGNDSPLADLAITYFDYQQLSDGTFEYLIDVSNQGNEDAGFFYVDLFRDQEDAPQLMDDGEHYDAVTTLAAQTTTWVDMTISETCNGCTSWIYLDSYNFIEESDESNNVAGPLEVNQ